MKTFEFPQEMIDAVIRLRQLYETPDPQKECPLCVATWNKRGDPICERCPHVVIDGAEKCGDSRPCFNNIRVASHAGDPMYFLRRYAIDAYFCITPFGDNPTEWDIARAAAVRRAHIERCDRWLAVMVPEEVEHETV